MRIPDRLVKCVGFVSRPGQKLKYVGTVFGVGLRQPGTMHAPLHLVTAKHVADAIGADFVVGFNGKDGIPIFLETRGQAEWFFHPTDPNGVDVAVMPFAPGMGDLYDFVGLPSDSFATADRIVEYSIGLGDEVTNIGLFAPFHGKTHFIPIVRTGNIAMMPTDLVPTKFGDIEAYLVEGRSMGGLSGSPVFCRSTIHVAGISKGKQRFASGLGEFHFLGLMQGHWDKELFPQPDVKESVNMGVAIVVPATKILETLMHPQLASMREEAMRRIEAENPPTADVADDEPSFTQQAFEANFRKVTRVGTSESGEVKP